ncbi:MAG: hemerythrin domain-containing protein [Clostridiales bacterium]|nr:hemerythrin domain-containing protein [Clostridiales bacterium]
MDGINHLIEEHVLLRRMLTAIRKMCYDSVKKNRIDFEDFEKMMEFVNKFADTLHNTKEEEILYPRMLEEIGEAAEKIIKNDMLVDHERARDYIRDLAEALEKHKAGNVVSIIDIIANAVSYANLMGTHIKKEKGELFALAKKQMSKESLEQINDEFGEYEKKMESDTEYTYETQIITRDIVRQANKDFSYGRDSRPTGQKIERTADEWTHFEKNIERHRIKMKYSSLVEVLEAKYVFNDSGMGM